MEAPSSFFSLLLCSLCLVRLRLLSTPYVTACFSPNIDALPLVRRVSLSECSPDLSVCSPYTTTSIPISHLSPSTFVLCVGFGLFSFLENRGPCAKDYMTSFSGGFAADAMSNLGNRSLKLSRNSFSGPFFWLQSRMCPSLNPLWITCIELFFGRYPRFRRGVCE